MHFEEVKSMVNSEDEYPAQGRERRQLNYGLVRMMGEWKCMYLKINTSRCWRSCSTADEIWLVWRIGNVKRVKRTKRMK